MGSRVEATLVGQSLRRVIWLHDYVQLEFQRGVILSIFNAFTVTGIPEGELDSLIGKTVTKVSSSLESVVIRFGSGATISVDLRDTGYRHGGPEAMTLHSPGEPTIVWAPFVSSR
jgi:hypothetical protein